jgi:hypothetical protein
VRWKRLSYMAQEENEYSAGMINKISEELKEHNG